MASLIFDSLNQRRGMPPCQDKGHWQGRVKKSSLLGEEPIAQYGLKGMG